MSSLELIVLSECMMRSELNLVKPSISDDINKTKLNEKFKDIVTFSEGIRFLVAVRQKHFSTLPFRYYNISELILSLLFHFVT